MWRHSNDTLKNNIRTKKHSAKTVVAAGWKRSPVGSYFPKLTMAAHLIWENICLNTKAADCTMFDGLKAKFANSRLNNYWVVIETCFSLPFVHILSEHFYTGCTEMSECYLCSRRVRRLKPQTVNGKKLQMFAVDQHQASCWALQETELRSGTTFFGVFLHVWPLIIISI